MMFNYFEKLYLLKTLRLHLLTNYCPNIEIGVSATGLSRIFLKNIDIEDTDDKYEFEIVFDVLHFQKTEKMVMKK